MLLRSRTGASPQEEDPDEDDDDDREEREEESLDETLGLRAFRYTSPTATISSICSFPSDADSGSACPNERCRAGDAMDRRRAPGLPPMGSSNLAGFSGEMQLGIFLLKRLPGSATPETARHRLPTETKASKGGAPDTGGALETTGVLMTAAVLGTMLKSSREPATPGVLETPGMLETAGVLVTATSLQISTSPIVFGILGSDVFFARRLIPIAPSSSSEEDTQMNR